ncbi:MAG TPA: SDR family oxidoreductase [Bryobacteraceae bacterium]|jgi:uncharacterized protein YbjT (DUF2867 family)
MSIHTITGATGNIGSLVVERLIARGIRPRIFVRNAENARARFGGENRVEIHTGDLADAASLASVLAGADSLFLVNSGPDIGALDELAAKVAHAAGLRHLVKLSSYDARPEHNCGTGVWHAQGESAIRASGVPFTFLQPTGFMTNARWWAQSIKEHGVVRSATGSGAIPFIHSNDIADVVVETLTKPAEFIGECLPLTGPEALTYAEMAAKIGAVIGKPICFEAISDDEARSQQFAWKASRAMVEARISIFRAIREGRLATVTDTVERILNRKPIRFDQWAQENAAAFTAS